MNLPILSLIVANVIWGAASPIFKWSLQTTPLFTLAFIRFYFASLILLLILRKKVFNFHKEDFPQMLLVGFFGVTCNIIFFFLGLKLSKAINAPIIASTQPLIIFVIAALFLHEKVKLNKIIGLVLGFGGVLFIIAKPFVEHGFNPEVMGDLLLLLATLGAVGQTIFAKKLMNEHKKLDPFVLTFWMFFVGTISFIPFMIPEILDPKFTLVSLLAPQPLVGILFGVFLCSLAAYALYMYGLSKITASETGLFTYIDPIAAIAIAIPLLHETISWEFVVGSVLIFVGIYVAEHRIHYHPLHRLLTHHSIIK